MVKYKDHHGKTLYFMVDSAFYPIYFALNGATKYGIIFSQESHAPLTFYIEKGGLDEKTRQNKGHSHRNALGSGNILGARPFGIGKPRACLARLFCRFQNYL